MEAIAPSATCPQHAQPALGTCGRCVFPEAALLAAYFGLRHKVEEDALAPEGV